MLVTEAPFQIEMDDSGKELNRKVAGWREIGG